MQQPRLRQKICLDQPAITPTPEEPEIIETPEEIIEETPEVIETPETTAEETTKETQTQEKTEEKIETAPATVEQTLEVATKTISTISAPHTGYSAAATMSNVFLMILGALFATIALTALLARAGKKAKRGVVVFMAFVALGFSSLAIAPSTYATTSEADCAEWEYTEYDVVVEYRISNVLDPRYTAKQSIEKQGFVFVNLTDSEIVEGTHTYTRDTMDMFKGVNTEEDKKNIENLIRATSPVSELWNEICTVMSCEVEYGYRYSESDPSIRGYGHEWAGLYSAKIIPPAEDDELQKYIVEYPAVYVGISDEE